MADKSKVIVGIAKALYNAGLVAVGVLAINIAYNKGQLDAHKKDAELLKDAIGKLDEAIESNEEEEL